MYLMEALTENQKACTLSGENEMLSVFRSKQIKERNSYGIL